MYLRRLLVKDSVWFPPLPTGSLPPEHLPPAFPERRAKAGPRSGDNRCSPSAEGGKEREEKWGAGSDVPLEPARALLGSADRMAGVRGSEP